MLKPPCCWRAASPAARLDPARRSPSGKRSCAHPGAFPVQLASSACARLEPWHGSALLLRPCCSAPLLCCSGPLGPWIMCRCCFGQLRGKKSNRRVSLLMPLLCVCVRTEYIMPSTVVNQLWATKLSKNKFAPWPSNKPTDDFTHFYL